MVALGYIPQLLSLSLSLMAALACIHNLQSHCLLLQPVCWCSLLRFGLAVIIRKPQIWAVWNMPAAIIRLYIGLQSISRVPLLLLLSL
ncbi:uncharacterized protein P174DRAFT_444974 [Aspergillus novofumigatus IBT 16806]|uniref:Uncharacterized protein n=1 Tax=Aspergillus novofumigatus (strain IBT 16806) TaxID=1392255 RepID=A0A2I1C0Z0_ASPN1|nr:uncharacterized protein P174DRAFT_444974 [Aspergillus novofumigatus IBT 16806]PKX91302.1 hypothetical protein P174DRAFT_444974 [Aspergillus novofumigatus IBT 16806]